MSACMASSWPTQFLTLFSSGNGAMDIHRMTAYIDGRLVLSKVGYTPDPITKGISDTIQQKLVGQSQLWVFEYQLQTATPQINISQLLPWKKRKVVPSPALGPPPVSSSINDKPVPIRALFVRRVLIATGSYAGIALVDIAFRIVQPVFYATPISLGGLGLDTPTIGTILAVQGIVNGVMQPLAFARLHDIMGAKKLWLFAVTCTLPMVALLLTLNTLARSSGVVQSVWYLVALQIVLVGCTNFAYVISFMYITAASPNRASVGATNRFAQVIVSVMCTVGPAAANSAFSISIEKQYLGGNLIYCRRPCYKACICQWTVQHVAVEGGLVKFKEDEPQKGLVLVA
ncbi:hypothetical protein BDR05DRAFT_993464 [Suillus weaverae]|nr:hypothetical protein BDR05DRAFT_993464 [Suillus weaverae]